MRMNKSTNDPWSVIHYEVLMYWGTRKAIDIVMKMPEGDVIRNAVTDSLVLHTRSLIEFLLSKGKYPDDILLIKLLPNWVALEGKEYLQKLKDAYGGTNIQNSPCWVINKMLAHPTIFRTYRFDYGSTMNKVDPIVFDILQSLSTSVPLI